jgi:hypothetical protein
MPDPNFRILAESKHFVVGHLFEQAFVIRKSDGTEHPAGDHYGDPSVALIAPDESWFLVGGEGLTFFNPHVGVLEFLRPTPTNEVTVRYESPNGRAVSFEALASHTKESVFVDRLELTESGAIQVFEADAPEPAWTFNPSEHSVTPRPPRDVSFEVQHCRNANSTVTLVTHPRSHAERQRWLNSHETL